jgi:hypothetical protein
VSDHRPQRHHVVPQVLLRRFTSTGRKGGLLTAIHLATGKVSRCPTNTVGTVDDFYRYRGIPNENEMEEGLAQIVETAGARALRSIDDRREALDDDDRLADLLVFVAWLYVRTPQFRRWYLELCEHFTQQWMHIKTGSRGWSERYLVERRAMGDTSISREQVERVRRMFEPGNMKYSFPPEAHIKAMIEHSEDIFDMLCDRQWSLVTATPGTGGFVCSDNPVTLEWSFLSTERPNYPLPDAPGFTDTRSEIFVPLGTYVGLLGRFDGKRLRPSDYIVASLNSRVIAHADEHVFARGMDFRWLSRDGVKGADDLLVDGRREKNEKVPRGGT